MRGALSFAVRFVAGADNIPADYLSRDILSKTSTMKQRRIAEQHLFMMRSDLAAAAQAQSADDDNDISIDVDDEKAAVAAFPPILPVFGPEEIERVRAWDRQ